MPEESPTPAGDRPSSRVATVSGSDDPKSSGKRSRNPAISTGVWFEEWYARCCSKPRGRHGRGRGRRGMSAMEIGRFMVRILGPRQMVGEGILHAKEPGLIASAHPTSDEEEERELGPPQEWPAWPDNLQMVGEGIAKAEEPGLIEFHPTSDEEEEPGLIEFDHPTGDEEEEIAAHDHHTSDDEKERERGSAWPDMGVMPLKRLRVEGNITGSAQGDVAVKMPRLTAGDVSVDPQVPHFDLLQMEEGGLDLLQQEEGGDTVESGEGVLGANRRLKTLDETGVRVSEALMDVFMATEESRLAEVPVEEPMAGKAGSEIALAKGGMEEPVASKTDGLIATEEPRPTDGVMAYPVAGKTGGEIATKESRPEEGALGKPLAGKTDAEIALAKRWLPHRYPVYPSTGKFEDFLKYNTESEMISKLNKAGYDRTKNLPTWGVESDHETMPSVKCQEMGIFLKAGKSVVAVSSIGPGHDNTGFYCSGVIISCDEDGVGTVRILTSSGVLYDDNDELHNPEQKVFVKLSNGRKYEGRVLYVNIHYNIAILEVCVGSSMSALRFGSMPEYGQRVIALGRDSSNLFQRDAIISRWEQTALGRTYYMFPKSTNGFPLISTGGPVIGEDGAMVGIITCHVPKAAMMSVSILKICLDMWNNYSCIARPQINMNLRTVQMLPMNKQDKVQGIYNIHSGFVIDGVEYDSTPEKVGIRKGDIIEIVDENCGSTLPELETYLLLHGLGFLRKMEGLSRPKELELKIRVHDLVEGSSTDTHLSIPVVYEVALP